MIGFVQKILQKENKGPLLNAFIQLMRFFARQRLFVPIVVSIIAKKIEKISGADGKDCIHILVLNKERYESDLEVLAQHPRVCLWSLPFQLQSMINSLWLSSIEDLSKSDPVFFENAHPDVKKARDALSVYLGHFIKGLNKKIGIQAIVSCTFWYKPDQDWMRGGERAGVPFVALHKECLQDPVQHEDSIKRYVNLKLNFKGAKIIVHNKLAKDVFERAGLANQNEIAVSGVLRFDHMFKALDSLKPPKKQVTLFSSHHCTGLLILPDETHCFSNDPNQGFVRYFDVVHGKMAEFAAQNPDVDVWIKPKWMAHWADKIEEAIEKAGYKLEDLPNLHIGVEKTAFELIEESQVIVGINTTTLLEAKLMGRRVVIPVVAEARDKYLNTNVFFQKYMDSDFNTVQDEDKIIDEIMAELEGKRPERPTSEDMINDYLGFFDGKTVDRVVDVIDQEIVAAQG